MADSMSVLLTSGMDAFTNLYDVEIWLPTSSGPSMDTSESWSVRALGFNPPELSAEEYQVAYKGVKLTRYSAKISGTREFTLEFRNDSEFNLVKLLNEWKKKVVDPTLEGNINFGAFSTENTDANEMYGKVVVKAYKSDTSLVAGTSGVTWTFDQVICTNIGSPAFSRAGAEPTRITAKFMFMDYRIE
jgi:hypothetical protein